MRTLRKTALTSLAVLTITGSLSGVFFGTLGCNLSDFGEDPTDPNDPSDPNNPGSALWGSGDITCEMTTDCGEGEVCDGEVCQPAQCDTAPYLSLPPIGSRRVFYADEEIALFDDAARGGRYYFDIYKPNGSNLGDGQSIVSSSNSKPIDIASGDLLGTEKHAFVSVKQGASQLEVIPVEGEAFTIDLGLIPVAFAATDTDADGIKEIAALAANGKVAICQVDQNSCESHDLDSSIVDGHIGIDIAGADVDGDGVDEPVLLLRSGSSYRVAVWNLDASEDDDEYYVSAAGSGILAIAGGDLDGDGIDEIAWLREAGFNNSVEVRALSPTGSLSPKGNANASFGSTDIAMGEIDADDRDELVVVNPTGDIELFSWNWNGGQLYRERSWSTGRSHNPKRVALLDSDGDSVAATLTGIQPELIAGPLRPVFALALPPYDIDHSNGASKAGVGLEESESESTKDSVSTAVGYEFGFKLDFLEIFEGEIGGKFETAIKQSQGYSESIKTGDRARLKARPQNYGYSYGGVLLSSGCFHAYEYVLDDASGALGANGEQIVVLAPVDGNTIFWSTTRYNALARERDDLPEIEFDMIIGDVSSYPSVPTRLDGSEVSEQDMVFPDPPSLRVSDVGEVGFSLARGEQVTNAYAEKTKVEIGTKVSTELFGGELEFGAYQSQSVETGYQIKLGETVKFSGSIPTIRDKASTPEDEYQVFAYSYRPYVYIQTYEDGEGNTSGFYVLNYTSSP